MHYDFTVVQKEFTKSGLTLEQFAAKTKPIRRNGKPARIHCGTISRALSTGNAHQATAKAMVEVFGIPYEKLKPQRKKRVA